MRKYLNSYISKFEQDLNVELLDKKADEPLVEFIKDSWRSLEVLKSIKILGFDYVDTESKIDNDKYAFKRDKKKKKKERFKNKAIDDDRCGSLTTHIQLTVDEIDPKTQKKITVKKIIHKSMLIPIEDNGFRLKGKNYYSIYQLTDKSTYTTSSSVTLKSLMPIAIKRESIEVCSVPENKDEDGISFLLPVYSVYVYRKDTPVILFYFSNGYKWAMNYLGVSEIIKLKSSLNDADFENNLYFQISSKCYLEVYKPIFSSSNYVQGIVGMILSVSTNRLTIDNYYDKNVWIKKLSTPQGNLEKGKYLLLSFNRLLDERSRKNYKIPEIQKNNVYAIIRWMLMEYNILRLKDNMSLTNKRLRANEQYSALFDLELSNRLTRIIGLGAKADMNKYLELFRFSGEILIQKMHQSGILRYDDNINDMDFFSKFKFSTKGPHSLGSKNEKRIPTKYRDIHPSYIGYIDLMVCGNSDPGTSGTLSPFSNLDGFYFNSDTEPDEYLFDISKAVKEKMKKEGYIILDINTDNKEEYYNMLNNIDKFTKENVYISGKAKNDNEIVIETDDNMEVEE